MYQPTEETLRCEEPLDTAMPGELVTYHVLSDAAGKNVQKEGRVHLNSARRRQLKKGRAFETVFNVGLRCVINGDQVPIAQRALRHVGNKMRKTRKVLNTTNVSLLPAQERNDYHVTSATVTHIKNETSTRRMLALRKQLATAKVTKDRDAMKALLDRTIEGFRSGKLKEAKKA
jgi:hypothetical protein